MRLDSARPSRDAQPASPTQAMECRGNVNWAPIARPLEIAQPASLDNTLECRGNDNGASSARPSVISQPALLDTATEGCSNVLWASPPVPPSEGSGRTKKGKMKKKKKNKPNEDVSWASHRASPTVTPGDGSGNKKKRKKKKKVQSASSSPEKDNRVWASPPVQPRNSLGNTKKKKKKKNKAEPPPTESPPAVLFWDPNVRLWDPNVCDDKSLDRSGLEPTEIHSSGWIETRSQPNLDGTTPSGRISNKSVPQPPPPAQPLPRYHTINGVTYMHVNGYQRVDVPSLFHSSVPRQPPQAMPNHGYGLGAPPYQPFYAEHQQHGRLHGYYGDGHYFGGNWDRNHGGSY